MDNVQGISILKKVKKNVTLQNCKDSGDDGTTFSQKTLVLESIIEEITPEKS